MFVGYEERQVGRLTMCLLAEREMGAPGVEVYVFPILRNQATTIAAKVHDL